MDKNYETLVLPGGAMKGFILLGCIQFLQDQDKLHNIKRFVGTSIGGIIAYLICIGYSPTEIMIYLHQESSFFEKFQNMNLVNLINDMGALPFSFVQDFFERMTVNKIKRYITLGELHEKFGKELVLCVYNETLNKEEFISYKTHPQMNCITALRMTASLPFLFDAFVYEDYKFIDGAVSNNFPIDHVKDADTPTLGITFKYEFLYQNKSENLLSRIYKIIFLSYFKIEELNIREAIKNPNIEVIRVLDEKNNALTFSMTSKEKFDMFSLGYDTMKRYFQTPENSGSCLPSTL